MGEGISPLRVTISITLYANDEPIQPTNTAD